MVQALWNNNMRLAPTLLTALLLVGCSSQPRTPGGVIVDRRGVDPIRYAADLDECAAYADEVRAADKVVANSAGGAVVGGAVGSIYKSGSGSRGAAAGAVTGAVKGIADTSNERSLVVKNCLRQRGYVVLN